MNDSNSISANGIAAPDVKVTEVEGLVVIRVVGVAVVISHISP